MPAASRVDRDRAGAGDVSGGVLGGGSDVDDHDVAGGEPLGELVAADLLEPAAVAEVGGGQLVELVVVGGGDVAQRRPEFADTVGGEPVVDPGPVASGGDETGAGEDPEVERGVGDALADLVSQLLDVALALGEHVDELGAAPVAERLGDLGEGVEQRILRLPITHRQPPQRTA